MFHYSSVSAVAAAVIFLLVFSPASALFNLRSMEYPRTSPRFRRPHPGAASSPYDITCASSRQGEQFNQSALVYKLQWDLPSSDVQPLCCNLAAGFAGQGQAAKYSVTVLGPSKKYKDEVTSICSVYAATALAEPAENQTTSSGLTNPNPTLPPPPPCSGFTTLKSCPSYCFWQQANISDPGTCSATPPIHHCRNSYYLETTLDAWPADLIEPPLCFNMEITPSPFASVNQIWNWSSGEITDGAKILVMPPQTIVTGNSSYFSFASGFVKNQSAPQGVTVVPWGMCVTYTQLDQSGQPTSTQFKWCAFVNEAGFDINGPVCQGGCNDLTFTPAWISSPSTAAGIGTFYGRILVTQNGTAMT